ncbi:Biogenesis of lysosome-related organelles complex 1 subunit [Sesamum angolense]|uniref:Biogenesis of lysosome-related organelles complex 1 subunit 1 n=1 Tax=Sesamum angolense TaxID=2727404 RepID=A0AAE1T5D2_9LAMI|nr:Biogenesis of lysosome-related organelles complex 1 subunit [Sesamum angolense]
MERSYQVEVGSLEASLLQIINDHNHASVELREHTEVFINEKRIEMEIRALAATIMRFSKQTDQWLAASHAINNAVKEIGDFENWMKTMELDCKSISAAIFLIISRDGDYATQMAESALNTSNISIPQPNEEPFGLKVTEAAFIGIMYNEIVKGSVRGFNFCPSQWTYILGWVLMEEEDLGVVMPARVWHSSSDSGDFYTVGCVLSHKPYHVEALKTVRKSSLNPAKELASSLWAFEKNLFILVQVFVNNNLAEVDLTWCNFQVQIHRLPLGKTTTEIASFIVGLPGPLKDFDLFKDPELWGSFMRLRFAINVSKPLSRALKLQTILGDEHIVTFTYERFLTFATYVGGLDISRSGVSPLLKRILLTLNVLAPASTCSHFLLLRQRGAVLSLVISSILKLPQKSVKLQSFSSYHINILVRFNATNDQWRFSGFMVNLTRASGVPLSCGVMINISSILFERDLIELVLMQHGLSPFPEACVRHVGSPYSDHTPLVVKLRPMVYWNLLGSRKCFWFEVTWLQELVSEKLFLKLGLP